MTVVLVDVAARQRAMASLARAAGSAGAVGRWVVRRREPSPSPVSPGTPLPSLTRFLTGDD